MKRSRGGPPDARRRHDDRGSGASAVPDANRWKVRDSSCAGSGRATGIRGPSQDPVVRRGDLEYQRLVQPQALQSIALAVAEARSVNLLLQRIVEGLAGQPETALARIWLRGPGDLCLS